MNTNIRWLAAYTADIFDDYLAEMMQTVVTALLRPGMLFLRTGFGVVIPGSYSPGVARCASGRQPLSVWRISGS